MKAMLQALLLPLVLLSLSAAPSLTLENDARLELALRNTYTFRTFLKTDAISVRCRVGAVTLTGTVADALHKLLATETAANLPGVLSVDDRLALQGKQAPELSDAWISTKVKTALLLHSRRSGADAQVVTREGVVTLKGTAISPAEKERCSEVASDILGVKALTNDMTIASAAEPRLPKAPGEEVDDASLTAQIKAALRLRHSTHLLAAKVRTEAGAVTLSGLAEDAGEKARVTRLVNAIEGVKTVDNRMIIVRPTS